MKFYYILTLSLLLAIQASAQNTTDTSKFSFTAIEYTPQFPGGLQNFTTYISKNLKYPDVARLIGIDGKVLLTFVVEKDGRVVDVKPVTCIGAGCEAEAVSVLENSPAWKPGIQHGKPVRVQYRVPINFNVTKGKVTMKELRKSEYGFLFFIKDNIYTIDEAEVILGKSFHSTQVEIAEPYNNVEKYAMPDKKEVYLLKMKK